MAPGPPRVFGHDEETAERGFWERTRASWALILLSLIAVYLAFSSTRRTPLPADVVFLWAVIVMILGVIA